MKKTSYSNVQLSLIVLVISAVAAYSILYTAKITGGVTQTSLQLGYVPDELLVGVQAPPAPAPAPDTPTGLSQLGSNSWYKFNFAPRTVYQPYLRTAANGTQESVCDRTITDGNSIFRSFSGLTTGDGILFVFGGGHAGHPGNDVDLLDVAAGRYTQPYTPECPAPYSGTYRGVKGGGVATQGISPLGRPWVHHTYQNSAYDPVRKQFIFVGGEGTWAFEMSRFEWKHLVGRNKTLGPTWGSMGVIFYDPNNDRMVGIVATSANEANRGIYHFDLKTNTWSFVSPLPASSVDGYSPFSSSAYKLMNAAVVPERQEAIIHIRPVSPDGSTPQLFRYNLDTRIWTNVTSYKEGATPPSDNGAGPNFDYDLVNRMVVFSGSSGIWTWDPATDVWAKLPPSTTLAPASPGGTGRFVYDRVNQVFLYTEVGNLYCGVSNAACGAATKATWAYRLAKSNDSLPPPVLIPIVSLIATPSEVLAGGLTTLSWSSTSATSCTASGAWSGTKQTSGSESTGALTAAKTYTLTCTGTGGSSTKSVSVTVAATADTTPPSISSVSVAQVTATSASVSWSTSELATHQVEYGLSSSYGSQTPESVMLMTSHSETLQNLLPNTTYYFRVNSKDAAGNAASATGTFRTLVTTGTGDVNRDGKVDILDVLFVAQNLGKAATPAVDVAPPFGVIDLFDIMVVIANWDRTYVFVGTLTFSAAPVSVTSNGTSVLSWSTTDATSCTASGAWSGTKATSGTQTVGPLLSASSFTLQCNGAGGTVTKTVTISITSPPPPSAGFVIGAQVQATAKISVRNAAGLSALILGSQPPDQRGTITGGPTSADGYTWWQIDYYSGEDGWSSQSLLKIASPIVLAADIRADGSNGPVMINTNTSAFITWTSTVAASCSVTPSDWTGVYGSRTTERLTAPRTYTLTCTSGDQTVTDSVQITTAADTTPPPADPPAIVTSLPLTVQETAGVTRVNEPVTSGIPMPVGNNPAGPWALFDGSTEIPVSVTNLDGRAPWILLDFQLSIPTNGKKTLLLKKQLPSVVPPVINKARQAVEVTTIDATTGRTLTGVPDREVWEYNGPMRAVLRVDGHFGDVPGFGYTTRYTFYAGKSSVRIEHVLRNSLQTNERNLKLTSATVKVGDGTTSARSTYQGEITRVPGSSVTFEVLPIAQSGYRNVTVASNGGFILPDLTHYGATLLVDPAGEWAAPKSNLFALADASWYSAYGELSSRNFGTLQDEKDTYTSWGWTWPTSREPTVAARPDYVVNLDAVWVHGDTESDDLWQNIMMFVRTGNNGYLDRARGWANYFKWAFPYRSDNFEYKWEGSQERGGGNYIRPTITIPLTPHDTRYLVDAAGGKGDTHTDIGDHFYGWGLLDYYLLTGDREAITAAIDLGEQSERQWMWREGYNPTYGTRGIGRHLNLAVRLWDGTGDPRWKALADQLVRLLLNTSYWRESFGIYAWPDEDYGVGVHHIAEVGTSMYRYYELTGNPEVRRRLIKMAEFARDRGVDPVWLHASKRIRLDFPNSGDVSFGNDPLVEPLQVNPYHVWAWIDVLDRGFRLTGDISFLERVKLYWDVASKSGYLKPATYRTVGPNEVGRFLNNRLGCCGSNILMYEMNGQIPFAVQFFYDAARR